MKEDWIFQHKESCNSPSKIKQKHVLPLMQTEKILSVRKDLNLRFKSHDDRVLWSIVSNTVLRSKSIKITESPESVANNTSFSHYSSADSVL